MENTKDVLWTGPRLLIPMMMDGLVRTTKGNAIAFSDKPINFGNYKNYAQMNPDPFNSRNMSTDPPRPGVYLQWALPDGLTAGNEKEAGEIEYPLVPNRWMVIRFSADNPGSRQAWVVESDYLGDGPVGVDGKNDFLVQEGDTMVRKFLGTWYNMDDWTETGEESILFLTATGVSDPSFASYIPNIRYVFSFHDPIESVEAVSFSYLTCGWYSNPKGDPLYYEKTGAQNGWATQDEWLAVMQQYLWSVGDDEDLDHAKEASETWIRENVGGVGFSELWNVLPAQSLVHGLLFSVQWPGINVQPTSEVPTYNPSDPCSIPYVAAANTGIDALAAFMQYQLNYNIGCTGGNPEQDEDVGNLLQAFYYHLLPEVGATFDVPELGRAIHDDWFGTVHGGLIWLVQAPRTAGGLIPAETDQPLPQLNEEAASLLASLNDLQQTLDANQRERDSKSAQLYMNWWKLKYYDYGFPFGAPPGYPTKPQLDALVDEGKREVQALSDIIDTNERNIEEVINQLLPLLESLGNLELTNKPAPAFYQPNDPTFLLSGVDRSYKRGEDLIYVQENDYLFVRFTGQFLTNIEVEIGGETSTVEGSSLADPFPESAMYPKEIPAMLIESMLLDTNYAENIARIAMNGGDPTPEDIEQIQQQQTLIWNPALDSSLDVRTLEVPAGFNVGNELVHVPSKIGVSQWAPPWNPIQMRWKVAYYPAIELQNGEFTHWKFDGYDYRWTSGNNYPPESLPAATFKGSTVLTPKESYTMQTQLDAFIAQYHGDVPEEYIPLQDTLDAIGNWDVLSQAITNFGEMLLQWDLEQYGYKPTDEDTQKAVADMGQGILLNPSTNNTFFPLRAGFLKITGLWVVDEYGQIYDLLTSSGSSQNNFAPIPGMGFEPGSYKLNLQLPQYIQIPPRIVQPSRLNLDFVAAANDRIMSSDVDGTTPICGWLLPNHLNQGLLVYNSEGQILGQIMLVGDTGNQHAVWQVAVETGVEPEGIENAHLQSFVTDLIGLNDSGRAFKNFLATIDETQWAVDPLGNRENVNLSIIVGEPIAMVRAAYSLELQGDPAYKINWENTLNDDPGPLPDVKFPLQIGNIDMVGDGVMGYFAGDDYTTFNSVHHGEVEAPAIPPYVVNNYLDVQVQQEPIYVSILLDPRGHIFTSSGILPILEKVLPDTYTKDPLNNMQIDFNTGPVLIQPEILQLNLPAGVGDEWTWFQPDQNESGDGSINWTEIATIVNGTAKAVMPEMPPIIRQGRLRLTGALGGQMALFFFLPSGLQKVPDTLPIAYTVAAGTKVFLSWSSQAALSASLIDGNTVDVNDLPTNEFSYEYNARENVTLTLTIYDSASNELSLSFKLIVE